jgi:trk system potassium uptake protein TrkA
MLEAGIDRADAFAAVSSGDNSNIIAARVARETFGIDNVVARIYDHRRAAVYQKLGIPTVATVSWTTDQVMRRLFPDSRAVDWTDPAGNISLIEVPLPEAWAGKRLSGLHGEGWRMVAVERGGAGRLFSDDLVGQDGDVLHIATDNRATDDLEQILASGGAH